MAKRTEMKQINARKERRFYNSLRDIFVGAKVEGESGYINLMKIKSRYFEEGVFPQLQKDIEEALKPFPDFREELFDKLYTFFNRYFSESGSIYFRYTPLHQNVYEKVYTDDKDVILFWKTHMLYYVKTDRLFKNLEVEIDGLKFFFDVSTLEHKRANEKRQIIYEFKKKRNDGALVFTVAYSERGRKTKVNDILRKLNRSDVKVKEEVLERAFRLFEKQSEVDYFINKNARAFLEEQFNLWLYQYVFSGQSQWTEQRIKQIQVLKDIAFKIIAFISQFEDELVKIWNKPKFVLNSNYVITLDRIEEKAGNLELVKKILNHKNFNQQVNEWKELGIAGKDFAKNKIIEKDLRAHLSEKYQHLPIDTKYFKDLELEILGLFDDLDNSLDGWLIKSENYQALNTILPKFKEKVQTIYIDPPFNKEQDADYFYSVKYKDASWITLLENRLQPARDMLNDTGNVFVRCDYNGNMFVRLLLNNFLDVFKNEIVVKRTRTLKGEPGRFHTATDTVYFYSKSPEALFKGFRTLKPESEWKWVEMHLPGTRKDEELLYRNFFGKRLKAPEGRRWALSQEAIDDAISKGLVKMDEKTGMPKFLTKYETLGSNWTDISGYSPTWNFTTENSEQVLQRIIESTSNEGDLILDFFLGIGTTTAVAHKLKRKWIGIEMGEHFWDFYQDGERTKTGVLGRMKEVLTGKGNHEPCGISKEVNWQGGGFFKYYELEQYEDTLRKVKYEDADLFDNPYEDPYNQYVFMKDLKMLEPLEIDIKKNKVKVDLTKLYEGIDIAETLSNLTGRWIKKIDSDFVQFEDGTELDTKNLDYKLIKPLIWW